MPVTFEWHFRLELIRGVAIGVGDEDFIPFEEGLAMAVGQVDRPVSLRSPAKRGPTVARTDCQLVPDRPRQTS